MNRICRQCGAEKPLWEFVDRNKQTGERRKFIVFVQLADLNVAKNDTSRDGKRYFPTKNSIVRN